MAKSAYPVIQECLESGRTTSHVAAIGYASSFDFRQRREEYLQFIVDWSVAHNQVKTAQAADEMLGKRQERATENHLLIDFL